MAEAVVRWPLVRQPRCDRSYRIYFGRDGDAIIILLGGGTKRRQQTDIEDARRLWQEYKRRKRQEA